MFDFGSEIRNEGGEKGRNQKGLVTIDRKVKKDAFYLCKAYWSKEPFVKLAGSRFVNRHKQLNDIVVLSNLSNIKLFVNDKLVDETSNSEPMKSFKNVSLSLGENSIRIEGFDGKSTIYTDEMMLNRVAKIDESYILPKQEEKKHVTNWFEKFDLSEVKEIVVKDGYYSIYDSVEKLYEDEQARTVFKKFFGETAEEPRFKVMMGLISIEGMSKRSMFRIPKELLGVINDELNVIPKK
jgi:beta-galactosidase